MEEREALYYGTLYQVARAVASAQNTPEVLRAIAESTTKAMQAKGCSLLLLSRDSKELQHRASCGLSDSYLKKGPVLVDRSMAEALTGRAVIITYVANDPRVQYRAQAVEEGIASILCVPIRLRNDVIGVIRVYTAEHREFDEDEIALVQDAANLGAIALENAHRYEEVKQSYDAVRQDLLDWYARGVWSPT